MRHDKTPLLAVAAALLVLQLAACGTKGPQTGNTSLPAGSESTPGKTEEGAVDPEKARAADQAQDAAASPADGKAADPAAGNTADAAATAASPDEGEPVDWDAHEKATAKAEKEAAAQEAAAVKLPQGQEIRDQDVRYTQNLIIHYDGSDDEAKQALLEAASSYGASVTYELDTMNVVVVRIPDGKPIGDAIAYFEKQKNVLAVNRDQVNELQ